MVDDDAKNEKNHVYKKDNEDGMMMVGKIVMMLKMIFIEIMMVMAASPWLETSSWW